VMVKRSRGEPRVANEAGNEGSAHTAVPELDRLGQSFFTIVPEHWSNLRAKRSDR
jgi:hypothetical protein